MTTAIQHRSSNLRFEEAALALIAAKRSVNTKRTYKANLQRWLSYCRAVGCEPSSPALTATTEYRDYLEASFANETARLAIASMSSVYRMLLRGGAVDRNPFHPSVLAWPPQNKVPKTTLISDKDAMAMIRNAASDTTRRGLRDAAVLQLLYDTGLRRVSVARILRSDYKDGVIRTLVKGDKEVDIELPDESIAAIDRWLDRAPASPHLFPGSKGHLNPATINKLVRERATAVGVKTRIHPHSFRAAFVTAGYDAGLPEREIQESVHHTDPKTTRRYDRGARGRKVATQVRKYRQGGGK